MQLDYRICKPIERIDRNGNTIFLIRCKVVRIGNFLERTSHEIFIEIYDFKTAQPKIVKGITYTKSLESFYNDSGELPFNTDCLVTKDENGDIKFIVYYFGSRVFVEKLFYPNDMFTEEEVMNLFKHNYKKLNSWISGV